MKTDYVPLYHDVEELSDDELSRAADARDSLAWYKRQNERGGGWTSQIERCQEELEELVGTSEVAELESLLGDDEPDEPDTREGEIAELQRRIQWYENHDWEKAAENCYDELADLKEGK